MKRSLEERLDAEGVLCAEGYLFELERRGYLTAGHFVPEVVLENPDALISLHKDFLHAGSDVILPFLYYANREKLKLIGKENLLEEMNRLAIRIAKQVAYSVKGDQEIPLVPGNLCNTNVYDALDKNTHKEVEAIYDEMLSWATDEGVDFVLCETFYQKGEALLALEACKKYNLDAVVTLAINNEKKTVDGFDYPETAKELYDKGAKVVGFNCFNGPFEMQTFVDELIKTVPAKYVAALPVPYRTNRENISFFNLPDNNACKVQSPYSRPFPLALEPLLMNRFEIEKWAKDSVEKGVKFLGLCCGASPMFIREVARAMGKNPPSLKYLPRMDKHFLYGSDEKVRDSTKKIGKIM